MWKMSLTKVLALLQAEWMNEFLFFHFHQSQWVLKLTDFHCHNWVIVCLTIKCHSRFLGVTFIEYYFRIHVVGHHWGIVVHLNWPLVKLWCLVSCTLLYFHAVLVVSGMPDCYLKETAWFCNVRPLFQDF